MEGYKRNLEDFRDEHWSSIDSQFSGDRRYCRCDAEGFWSNFVGYEKLVVVIVQPLCGVEFPMSG